jgi:hypothetical protein
MDTLDTANTGYPTIDGKNILSQSLQDFTYSKQQIDAKLGSTG